MYYTNLDALAIAKDDSSQLDSNMVFIFLFHVLIIILERFVSRSDTKIKKK
jgi:hypothetical protein